MDLSDVMPIFIAESRELLEEMESSLLSLESTPDDPEAVAAIFRAAHTIKGSAGLFALEAVVSFAHLVETILDKVRDGHLAVSSELIALLLASGDHMGFLISEVTGEEERSSDLSEREGLLKQRLAYFPEPVPVEGAPPEPNAADCWHLSIRFGQDLFRDGMDPASFLRYLSQVGEVVHLTTMTVALPRAAELDPESCYLGFEIALQSTATKEEIAAVFEFVQDGSIVRILPPYGKVQDYVSLIRELPEDDAILGEILVKSGALTRAEVDEVLQIQHCPAGRNLKACAFHDTGVACDSKCVSDPGAQCLMTEADQVKPLPLGKILVEQQVVQEPIVVAALEKQTQVREAKNRESKLLRVESDKLDYLINLVGELVIAGASANLTAQRAKNVAQMEANSLISRLVEEVRDTVLKLRMVQIGGTFTRFQRLARDVSQELGKDIDLIISGAETELDKTVVDKIGDPLTHLVRNSMDHGIEHADVRRARNKPLKGMVKLHAYHDSDAIVIEVSDDGGGLNRERILKKAIERGLVTAGQLLSDREILNLIFEPGFSTAEQVTNLSGRGVGMDVVRRDITALRGTIEIESTEGVGTAIRIRLPLTLAIIDGFLVEVGESSFVVPLEMVTECIELTAQQREESRDRDFLNLRGEVLPFIRLRELFDLPGKPGRRDNIVVVRYGSQKAGIVIDQLIGEFQTVIKPLGKIFSRLKGIGGSTILGSGEVALILDVPALLQQATKQQGAALGLPS